MTICAIIIWCKDISLIENWWLPILFSEKKKAEQGRVHKYVETERNIEPVVQYFFPY